MTIYYESGKPSIMAMFALGNTFLLKVITKPEFWLYMAFHGYAVNEAMASEDALWGSIDWKASGALGYFTTFFLIYYCGHCYRRFDDLYYASMEALNGVLLFNFELTVSLKDPSLWLHRQQASKYLLAATYHFFMGVCYDSHSDQEWAEIVKKGLLTKHEAVTIMRYPGPELLPVLSTWTMYIIDDALHQDVMHGPRAQEVGQVHNRLHNHLQNASHAFHRLARLVAMPIPYFYWHLVNFTLFLNLSLLSVLLCKWRAWITFLPFTLVVLMLMGLREVANHLADPFGSGGKIDFPIAKWLDYAYEHSVVMLKAFSNPAAYGWIDTAVMRDDLLFSEDHIRIQVDNDVLYKRQEDLLYVKGVFNWEQDAMPLQKLVRNEDVVELHARIQNSLQTLVQTPPPAAETEEETKRSQRVWSEDILRLEVELRAAQAELKAVRQEAKNDADIFAGEGIEAPKLGRGGSKEASDETGSAELEPDGSPRLRKPNRDGKNDRQNMWGTAQEASQFSSFDDARARIRGMLSSGSEAYADQRRERLPDDGLDMPIQEERDV